MLYLVEQIQWFLVFAALVGFIICWAFYESKELTELEQGNIKLEYLNDDLDRQVASCIALTKKGVLQ